MDPLNPIFAMGCLGLALGTAAILARCFGPAEPHGKYAAIDGLRGYLAFFVFLHHASVWFFYLRNGRWEPPPSSLYTQLGEGSVALFFMITGFLFFSKILEGRRRPVDWLRLYVSRVLRLLPLYLFAMVGLFGMALVLSRWQLNEPIPSVLEEMVQWMGFTVTGAPNINGVLRTSSIMAGVTWSLPYEWGFYGLLPILSLAIGVLPAAWATVFGLAVLISADYWHPGFFVTLPFLGGIVAALWVRSDRFCRAARRPAATLVILAALVTVAAFYPSAYAWGPVLLLSIAFALIAGGNTLFGALVAAPSRVLGEMGYSLYLLHGFLLFTIFRFVLGAPTAGQMSSSAHWLVIAAASPLLVACCFVTYRLIERPFMKRTGAVTAGLRAFFARVSLRTV
jgi:peptidoglycan/LPS O-acetylase OafA/YrhL